MQLCQDVKHISPWDFSQNDHANTSKNNFFSQGLGPWFQQVFLWNSWWFPPHFNGHSSDGIFAQTTTNGRCETLGWYQGPILWAYWHQSFLRQVEVGVNDWGEWRISRDLKPQRWIGSSFLGCWSHIPSDLNFLVGKWLIHGDFVAQNHGELKSFCSKS